MITKAEALANGLGKTSGAGKIISRIDQGVPFNYEGWMYIARDLNGKIPLWIRAVPEGTVVPNHNVLMTVESTDPKVPWVVGWFEGLLLQAAW